MDQTQVVHRDSLTSHHTKHLPSSLKNVTYLRRNYIFFYGFSNNLQMLVVYLHFSALSC